MTGSDTTVNVATGSLAAGTYTVKGAVKEGKADKPWETADCTASFTVKAYEPPTISCTANPSTIETTFSPLLLWGEPAELLLLPLLGIGRPVSGNGAVRSSIQRAPPPVGIPQRRRRQRPHRKREQNGILTAPYVPPAPHAQALCSIAFDKDKLRPARVDNEARACLDEVALDLEKQPDAKAVIVGKATAAEKAGPQSRKRRRRNTSMPRLRTWLPSAPSTPRHTW